MKGQTIKYSTDERDWVKTHCKMHRAKMTALFNQQFHRQLKQESLDALCARNRWMTGRTGHYKKGATPHNLGQKGKVGANKTSFKKGGVPHNLKPLGYERINSEGYLEIKRKNGFILKHRHAWQQAHGAIKKNSAIRFKDNNKMNCDINNLFIVTRHENLLINQAHYATEKEELKPTVLAVARLQAAAKRLTQTQ